MGATFADYKMSGLAEVWEREKEVEGPVQKKQER